MPAVRFLFDVISPYAYLAWPRVREVAARHGRVVEPVPVLLAGLLAHHGTKGPAEVPAKRTYIYQDCLRHAAALGVPLEPPPSHPFNPLLALRVAGLPTDPEVRAALVTALFDAVWAGGPGVEDPAVVERLAADVGVPDAVARASTPEAKARLRATTEAAVAAGAFGVPTMIVDDSLFWGLDSLGHLDWALQGGDRLDPDALARWDVLTPSAERKLR